VGLNTATDKGIYSGEDFMTWTYKGLPLGENGLDNYKAFVYIITNTINGKKYVGKKKAILY
jgi:hypothetical protein